MTASRLHVFVVLFIGLVAVVAHANKHITPLPTSSSRFWRKSTLSAARLKDEKRRDLDSAPIVSEGDLYEAAFDGHVDFLAEVLESVGRSQTESEAEVRAAFKNALLIASQEGKASFVKKLLTCGSGVVNGSERTQRSSTNSGGLSALLLASESGHEETVKILLEMGVNATAAGSERADGATPLLLAASNGHLGVVKALLAHPGVNPNHPTQSGVTALMAASNKGNMDIVKALLHAASHIDRQTRDGATALTMAAANGHLYVVLLLCAYGADWRLELADGSRAIDVATINGFQMPARILLAMESGDNEKKGCGGGDNDGEGENDYSFLPRHAREAGFMRV